jgi:hypothetical protein
MHVGYGITPFVQIVTHQASSIVRGDFQASAAAMLG